MTLTITEPTTAAAPRYVFVYGTLRRGQERDINRLLPAPVFIGTSQTLGTLYHLGACNYPGLRLGGASAVQGDVYRITPELERALDEIEQVWPVETAEYVRQHIPVLCAGVVLTCLVYEITVARAAGCAVIDSGDWLQRDMGQ